MKVVHILPNLRKGLSRNITSGVKDADGLRAGFNVSVQMDGQKPGSGGIAKKSLERKFFLAGPVDVRGINAKAISQVVPADKSFGFSNGYMPYIEFLDEDLPWRYTPLPSSDKLVPWLILIACKDGEFKINRSYEGIKSVTVNLEGVEGQELSTFYPDPAKFHTLAHVQITTPEGKDPLQHIKDNPDDGVSRLFCGRALVPQTKYTLFLVPAFELGRLAGLGKELSGDVGIEKLSWQQGAVSNEYPFYYQWSFTTGGETFMTLARKQKFLTEEEFAGLSPGLKADISDTGLKRYRTLNTPVDDSEPIDIPAALVKKGFSESQLKEEDAHMEQELKEDLLLKSPVFSDNTSVGEVYEDPWIVPPVYGARHILAGPKELDNDKSFLKDLNLKFRNRAAAGMGANVVKRNQEMFMNRAWGVIEDINALNQRIREFYQVLKTNDAAEEKITALRYYKFRPHAWGLQADAAIRVANAQSSASVNAVDLALDATDDSGRALNVMTTSMGPYTRTGGISVQELRDLTTPDLWKNSASGIIPREEPFRYVSGQEDFFVRNTDYSFLRNLFTVLHPKVSFSVQNNSPKVEINKQEHDAYFSFERTSAIDDSFLLVLLSSTCTIHNSGDVFKWLDDTDLFSYPNGLHNWSLRVLDNTLAEAKREYDKVWSGKENPNYDKLISHLQPLLSTSALLPLIYNGICLPVVFRCHGSETVYGKTNGVRVPLTVSYDYGLVMHQSRYEEIFGKSCPNGVAIKYYVWAGRINREADRYTEHYLYFIPSNKMRDLAGASDCSVYYLTNDNKGKEVTIKLKPSDNGTDLFEPDEDKKYGNPFWLGNVGIKRSKKTLLPQDRMSGSGKSKNFLKFRNNFLNELVNNWPEDLKGTRYLLVHKEKVGAHGALKDRGAKFCELALKKNKYYLYYKNGNLYLNRVCSSEGKSCIYLSSIDLFQTEGDKVKVDIDAIHKLLVSAHQNLQWFSQNIWRPNYIYSASEYYKNAKVMTADELAHTNAGKLIEEMLAAYSKAMTQVNGLHNIAMTDPELKKALEGEKTVSNIDTESKAPVVDADEINRKRLVSLAYEFAEKGITLDLMESNFDGKYPVMAAPIFPDPTSFYLREISEKFILPSVEELKMNSISCFQSNPAFEEAFLAGMNTEMGRELLWREYPTDERGSYFRKFWDQVTIPEDFGKGYFDIKYMHNWKDRLGENHEPGKGRMLVFVVKSELMTLYPQTSICLAQLKSNQGRNELESTLSPAMTGWLSNDTFMAGFYPGELKTTKGVYLTFVETDKSQRFKREGPGGSENVLSSQFATERADFGSVWGAEVEPSMLSL